MANNKAEPAMRRMSADDFIKQWWEQHFPGTKEPKWNSAITCADAADLLNKYYKYLESLPCGGSPMRPKRQESAREL